MKIESFRAVQKNVNSIANLTCDSVDYREAHMGGPGSIWALSSVEKYVGEVLNPREDDRFYSTIYNDDPIGAFHAQSMLDSPYFWAAKHNDLN